MATQETSNGRKIKHLWMVEDVPARGDREAKSFWTKIGVAFENRDGSYSLHLAAIPTNGKLQMRDRRKSRNSLIMSMSSRPVGSQRAG